MGAVARADEARHARRVADDVPGLVAHRHLDQHVAGEDLAVHGLALAVLDLDLLLDRDEDLEDLVLHAHRLDAVLEVGLDLVLVARVGVDHVPLLRGALGEASACAAPRATGEPPGAPRSGSRRPGLGRFGRLVCHGSTASSRELKSRSSTAM